MRTTNCPGRAGLGAALFAAVAALLLAGCAPSAPAADNAGDDGADSATANAEAEAAANDMAGADVITRRYSCEDGRAVVARYINSGVVNAMVDLDIAGAKRQLTQGVSASGARYLTEDGLTPGRTLVWWSKGDGAMLIESDPADTEGANDRMVNCDATAEVE